MLSINISNMDALIALLYPVQPISLIYTATAMYSTCFHSDVLYGRILFSWTSINIISGMHFMTHISKGISFGT